MKKIRTIILAASFALLINLGALAQSRSSGITVEKRQPEYVAVNENMAVNLIFPFPIKRAQWVSTAISVQQFKGVDNILLLKANRKDFPLTNVSVVTTDGHFYSYIIGYSSEITALNLDYKKSGGSAIASFPGNTIDQGALEFLAQKAVSQKSASGETKQKKYGIKLALNGIFINQNTMFFRLVLVNNTNVPYDIDQLKFYIRDQKKSKRTASQEVEILPVCVLGNAATVQGKSQQTIVCAFEKFTTNLDKFLAIEMMEKNGGRNLAVKVGNKSIIKAKNL